VTVEAASIAGWGDRLGKLRPGYYADLLVLDDLRGDPYENLLHATERNVRLVVIAGHARHGDAELMRTAAPAADLEAINVGGRDKAMNLRHPSSPLNHIRFADAREALERALADLPAARDATVFEPFDDADAIEVELDMQFDEAADPDMLDLLAEVTLPNSVKLDGPTVIDDPDYWTMLEAVPHLPAHIRGENGLRRFYG
jgi:hypothetical protein